MTSAHAPVVRRRPPQPFVARVIRTVLIHPVAMEFKRRLRDLRWRFKGRAIRNPPLPPSVRSVLFVCLGNICRSPFAAQAARRAFGDAGLTDVRCTSAGIRATQASRSPGEACQASARRGVSLDAHVPSELTATMIAGHDAIVVMEASHFEQLRADYTDASDRIFLLPLFDEAQAGAYERYNIGDPFGRPEATFDACYERIERALTRWAALLAGGQDRG